MPRSPSAATALVLLVLAAACSSSGSRPEASPTSGQDATPQTQQGNLFVNPGFEDGREPWFSLGEPDFIRAVDYTHLGKASALLHMRDGAEVGGDAKVYYLVQELNPSEFPQELSGYYRVEHWEKGTPKQYLQFVVIVFGATDLPGGYPNHQIRYPLAGIDEEPFPITNAHFVFLGKDEPLTGDWVPFKVNLAGDFERLWGAVPQHWDKIRVLFEVRWDDKEPGQASEADVYYDDLYIGAAQDGGDS